jgi:hypothetical protein
MRASSLSVPFLRSAAVAAFASGCLVNGSQALAASAGSVASPQTGAAFSRPGGTVARSNQRPAEQVMVSDSFANVVSVFDAEGHLQTRLKKGVDYPFGITTDAAGNLYVANTGASNVLVYAQPYKAVTRVLTLPNQSPADVAVSTAGVIAVMGSTFPSGPGNVFLYANGATSACAMVGDLNWHNVFFGAFDASGNLFINGYDRDGNPLVGEISGGCAATSIVTLSVANTISGIAGMQVVNGNLLILAQNYNTFNPQIFTYAPPSGGSLGSPIATTNLSQGIEMETFAMTRGGRDLWIAHSDVAYGRIEYTYPGGRFVKSFNEPTLMNAFGIAVNPAASP